MERKVIEETRVKVCFAFLKTTQDACLVSDVALNVSLLEVKSNYIQMETTAVMALVGSIRPLLIERAALAARRPRSLRHLALLFPPTLECSNSP